ncbi:hypothetical protein N7456_007858 [Penicillium angulare]|uniref:Uncharacterized protein n=1 Tax=Penicillium angulare TaxID=116970 RepID=A0A9W9FBG7_9EURO|nr:hypothetical protein N7456_007858 [Penicillium angulare]
MGITVLGNLQARRADQGKYMIEAFNNEKAANKINFSTETTTRTNVIDGSTYEELDPEKMLRNNPTMSKEIKDTIIGFVKEYGVLLPSTTTPFSLVTTDVEERASHPLNITTAFKFRRN